MTHTDREPDVELLVLCDRQLADIRRVRANVLAALAPMDDFAEFQRVREVAAGLIVAVFELDNERDWCEGIIQKLFDDRRERLGLTVQ